MIVLFLYKNVITYVWFNSMSIFFRRINGYSSDPETGKIDFKQSDALWIDLRCCPLSIGEEIVSRIDSALKLCVEKAITHLCIDKIDPRLRHVMTIFRIILARIPKTITELDIDFIPVFSMDFTKPFNFTIPSHIRYLALIYRNSYDFSYVLDNLPVCLEIFVVNFFTCLTNPPPCIRSIIATLCLWCSIEDIFETSASLKTVRLMGREHRRDGT